MKTSLAALVSLAVLVPTATAKFDVYWSTGGGVGGSFGRWVPHAKEPTCNEAKNAKTWGDSDDVSGNKIGVRCKGKCGADGAIDEMEMHFNKNAHWTFYKRPSNNLVDKDGKKIGKCYTQTDEHEYRCNVGPIGIFDGHKRLYCQTSKTIDDIRG
jgi:hypothetical protein